MAVNKRNWILQALLAVSVLSGTVFLTLNIGKNERLRTIENLENELRDSRQAFNYAQNKELPKSDKPSTKTLRTYNNQLKVRLNSLSDGRNGNGIRMVDLDQHHLVDALMAQLLSCASQNALTITQLSSAPVETAYKSTLLKTCQARQLVLQGSFRGLIDFLEALPNLDFTVLVESLSINKIQHSDQISVQMHLLI